MKITRLAGLLGMALLVGCATTSKALRAAETGPYYRVFRGVQRQDIPIAEFRRKLVSEFIPALPALQEKLGARVYIPALTPDNKPAGLADEFAMVEYDSESAYRAARETPVGKQYGDRHWTVFDSTRTKTGGAVAFAGTVEAETPYDVLGKKTDWQSGYVTFYVGLRKAGVSEVDFLKGMAKHVADVKAVLEPQGLDAYVMVANGQYEAAWQRWPSQEAAQKAFASPAFQALIPEGSSLLENLQFSEAARFVGTLAPGQAVNVPIGTR